MLRGFCFKLRQESCLLRLKQRVPGKCSCPLAKTNSPAAGTCLWLAFIFNLKGSTRFMAQVTSQKNVFAGRGITPRTRIVIIAQAAAYLLPRLSDQNEIYRIRSQTNPSRLPSLRKSRDRFWRQRLRRNECTGNVSVEHNSYQTTRPGYRN
jgi:hypothetical protein